MSTASAIFVAGIVGVFLGMSMLYIGIRLMPFLTNKLEQRGEKND